MRVKMGGNKVKQKQCVVPSELFYLRTVILGECDTISEGIIDVRLGGKVDDCVNLLRAKEVVNEVGTSNVPCHE